MFERILIPLDGSERAELILDHVGKILRKEYSEVILLRVVDLPLLVRGAEAAMQGDSDRLRAQQKEEARKYLGEVAGRLSGLVARVSGHVVEGPSAETILRQARSAKATMIAMTTHGRTGLARWALGSVAEKVARTGTVPIFLVRSFGPDPRDAAASAGEPSIRKILVPLDGSPAAASALAPAGEVARLFGAEVVLLHAEMPFVLPGPEFGAYLPALPTPADKDPVTGGPADDLQKGGIRVRRRTEVGDPASVILDQSQDGADLIVMATHGRSGVARWVIGSVAERVLRGARVPLLLVRSEKAARTAADRKKAAGAAKA